MRRTFGAQPKRLGRGFSSRAPIVREIRSGASGSANRAQAARPDCPRSMNIFGDMSALRRAWRCRERGSCNWWKSEHVIAGLCFEAVSQRVPRPATEGSRPCELACVPIGHGRFAALDGVSTREPPPQRDADAPGRAPIVRSARQKPRGAAANAESHPAKSRNCPGTRIALARADCPAPVAIQYSVCHRAQALRPVSQHVGQSRADDRTTRLTLEPSGPPQERTASTPAAASADSRA